MQGNGELGPMSTGLGFALVLHTWVRMGHGMCWVQAESFQLPHLWYSRAVHFFLTGIQCQSMDLTPQGRWKPKDS